MAAGEIELIRRHFAELTPPRGDVPLGIGDDAALLKVPAGCELAVSTDVLVSGVHFAADASAFDVGFKSLAVNLSDMAAMGAEPRWATLVLTLPSADESWLAGFASGFRELAARFDVALVGGDLSRGSLSAAVQIMGVVPDGTALRRDGARPGDEVYVTGELGAAALALHLLESGSAAPPAECLERLHRPLPRVAAGTRLRGLARSAIDVSDGLFLDLARLTDASGVGADIELERVPMCGAVVAIKDRDLRLQLGLGTGDDYELCFTAPPGSGRAIAAAGTGAGVVMTRIGTIGTARGVRWRLEDGSEFRPRGTGYLHF